MRAPADRGPSVLSKLRCAVSRPDVPRGATGGPLLLRVRARWGAADIFGIDNGGLTLLVVTVIVVAVLSALAFIVYVDFSHIGIGPPRGTARRRCATREHARPPEISRTM